MKQIKDLNLPLETIERWLRDSDCDVRAAAMNACQGRDVPLETIERWLRDSDCYVRAAARNACQGRDVLPDRTFEPPKIVYKKCIGGVIVCATIPADAHVRGGRGGKCRASKATICGIIGKVMGESLGISIYDQNTVYQTGDTVEIENFDLSMGICSTGFHFFCTREEAEAYN